MNRAGAGIRVCVAVTVGRMGYDSTDMRDTSGPFAFEGDAVTRSLLKPAQDAPTRTW